MVNQAAMKALADVTARRKWGNSKSGGPVTTNLLCAEIARLNIVQEEMLAALKLARECITYCRRAHPDAQKGDGIPAEVFIDAAIATATGRNPQQGEQR